MLELGLKFKTAKEIIEVSLLRFNEE